MIESYIADDYAAINARMRELEAEQNAWRSKKDRDTPRYWCNSCSKEFSEENLFSVNNYFSTPIHYHYVTGACSCRAYPSCRQCNNTGFVDVVLPRGNITVICQECENPNGLIRP